MTDSLHPPAVPTNRRRTVDVLGFTLTHDRAASGVLGRDVYAWKATVRHGLAIVAQHHKVGTGGWILSVSCLGQAVTVSSQAVTVSSLTLAGATSKLGDELVRAPKLERAVRLERDTLAGR